MSNEDFRELSEGLGNIRRQREQVGDSPVVISVREMLAQINQDVLGGKAHNFLSGGDFDDLEFSLAWEGEYTKNRNVKLFNIEVQVSPFSLTVKPVRLEGEDWLRFKVTANYTGEEDSVTEIGITERLDPEQLKPILESQIDAIKESARK